ncbi:MAG TPA: hypothetical protein VKT78_05180 [Fimbriimonadaceae bacterium]|nr:hypothetical protein [Fimbriimonadaceae bacterium]
MNRLYFAAFIGLTAVFCYAQSPHGRPTPKTQYDRPHLVGFEFISKTINFPVIQPSRKSFNPMFCTYVTLPKGFGHKFPAAQQVVDMEWGYKKGGVINLYETPAYGPKDAATFFKDLEATRIFKDRQGRPGWTVVPIPNKKIFVVLTSMDKAALDVAVSELKGH